MKLKRRKKEKYLTTFSINVDMKSNVVCFFYINVDMKSNVVCSSLFWYVVQNIVQ